MTYRIDESLSPLYLLHFYGHMGLDETKQMLAEVDVLLARGGRFGVVMIVNEDEPDEDFDRDFDGELDEDDDHDHRHKHKHEPGLAKTQKAWLVANRNRFEQDCVGIAMVSSNSKFVTFYAPLANKIISRMYRCPGALFGDANKGLAWVQARMPEPAAV